jgi:chromosome partitioning protein
MKTITIGGPKGGCGKTTTTLLLAVHACKAEQRVALFDMNADQGNIAQWSAARADLFGPDIIEVENLAEDVQILAQDGKHDLLVIDTPPVIDEAAIVEAAVAICDAVVIPVRPSILDIGAMPAMAEICAEHRKPFAFLLCDVTTSWTALNARSVAALTEIGPVMAARISHRMQYVNALTIGRTGPEIDKDLEHEVAALWSEISRLAGIKAAAGPTGAKKGRRHA